MNDALDLARAVKDDVVDDTRDKVAELQVAPGDDDAEPADWADVSRWRILATVLLTFAVPAFDSITDILAAIDIAFKSDCYAELTALSATQSSK